MDVNRLLRNCLVAVACVAPWETALAAQVATPQAATFAGAFSRQSSAAFTADGKLLITGATAAISSGNKEKVTLWDAATGKKRLDLVVFSWVHSVAISEDGKLLAAGRFNQVISLWDLAEAKGAK